jgi:hypothetical protein
MLEKPNIKNFQIWTPHEEKHQIFRFSPIFGQKFSNQDLLIHFHT